MYQKVHQREASSFYAYKRVDHNFEFYRHYHPEYEIVAITAGFGRRYIGDSISDYTSPEIVLVPPNVPHTWQSETNCCSNTAYVIQFSRQVLQAGGLELAEFAQVRNLLNSQRAYLFDFSDSNALKLFDDIVVSSGLESFTNLLRLLDRLCALKAAILSTATSINIPNNNDYNINRLFNYINENYLGDITLAEAAKQACMSQSAFCRFFKKVCGSSFITHINDLRIAAACRMLSDTDKPITQICYETGFGNIANFNRQFKKRKMQSPRQFKQQLSQTVRA